MRYREATHGDADEVAALHAESWRASYRGAFRDEFLDGDVVQDRIDVWRLRLSVPPDNQYVVVAERDGQLAGFGCAYGRSDEEWGTLLDNLHVRRDTQGQGTGTQLMAKVAAWCLAHHPEDGLYLWVLDQNRRAQRFYERLGGMHQGSEASEPPGGGQITGLRYIWANVGDLAIACRKNL